MQLKHPCAVCCRELFLISCLDEWERGEPKRGRTAESLAVPFCRFGTASCL
uniref:Uncharacterized protein n=1 Tax=Arundo donax TaxID=35708 RepID=A0A0A9CQZ5_ARUDO